jgi:hypothetical protein
VVDNVEMVRELGNGEDTEAKSRRADLAYDVFIFDSVGPTLVKVLVQCRNGLRSSAADPSSLSSGRSEKDGESGLLKKHRPSGLAEANRREVR